MMILIFSGIRRSVCAYRWLFAAVLVCVAVVVHGQQRIGPRHMKKYDGIDVSHHQGKIDWKKVAKDKKIKFVYIKATQGRTLIDKRYYENLREARRQGLKCGSYHYFSSETSVRAQVRLFTTIVQKKQQDLIPMVDVEREGMYLWSRRQVQDSLALFCKLVKKHYGKAPLIYSHYHYYNTHLAPQFNRYFLFLGKYSWPQPRINGLGKHNIWQYSERGKINGIRGYVDLDRFMSDTSLKDITL